MKKKISILLIVLMTSVLLVACAPKDNGTDTNVNVSVESIHEKVKEELGENYFPSMELSLEELSDRYGVNPDNVEDFVAEIPMISAHVDTFIAIQAEEGKGDSVEASLDAYEQMLVEQLTQYPMNMAKVEAAEVVRHGDYVFFTMLGAMDDENDADSAAGLKFAKEENQRVIDVIDSFFN